MKLRCKFPNCDSDNFGSIIGKQNHEKKCIWNLEDMKKKWGQDFIIVDNYKFHFHKFIQNNVERWICSEKTCQSFVETNANGEIIVTEINHNHKSKLDKKVKKKVDNKISVKMGEMLSRRGKDLIIVDNYKFRFHKNLQNNVQRWACTNSTCNSFIKTNENKEIIEKHTDHQHASTL